MFSDPGWQNHINTKNLKHDFDNTKKAVDIAITLALTVFCNVRNKITINSRMHAFKLLNNKGQILPYILV